MDFPEIFDIENVEIDTKIESITCIKLETDRLWDFYEEQW